MFSGRGRRWPGVRNRISSKTVRRTSSAASTASVPATTPGVIVLTRTGAICTASDLTSPITPSFAIDIVVDPRIGRHIDVPLNMTIDDVAVNFGSA